MGLQQALDDITSTLTQMKEAQAQKDIDLAWQSVHVAAAAACRGSAPNGGVGPWSNGVIAKQNGAKCTDQCNRLADRKVCRAEVAISGFPGKATSYTQFVGYFYNYKFDVGSNPDISHNEVAAKDADI